MNRPLVASLFVLACPFLALACTDDAVVAPISPDGGPSATAPSVSAPPADAAPLPPSDASAPEDAGADTGKPVCNDLRNIAADVPEMLEASDAPEATGGTLEDGTYVLVRATEHTGAGGRSGPTGKTMRMTIRRAGSRYDSVFDGVARSADVSFRGAEMMATTVCPGSSTMTLGYTATQSTLVVRFADGASTRVYAYEKR